VARCDQGYICEVCGHDVEVITESDLYLRYVLGEVPIFNLHQLRERHVRCNPAIAQFIVDPGFEPVTCDGPFDKRLFDVDYVTAEETRVTAGWRRLQAIPTMGVGLDEYPLPK
jgi:hypothetical protein